MFQEWILGQPVETDNVNCEWIGGQPFIVVSSIPEIYNVTGNLIPDATCNYPYAGIYDGESYYRRKDDAYSIWHHYMGYWVISDLPGNFPEGYWAGPDLIGDYTPVGTAKGIAFVAEGEHEEIGQSILDYERSVRGVNRGVMVGVA